MTLFSRAKLQLYYKKWKKQCNHFFHFTKIIVWAFTFPDFGGFNIPSVC